MDDPELKQLLTEIRDLQKAQLQLFRDWQQAVSGRQEDSIKDAEVWRQNHLAWQKRQVRSNRVFAVVMVCVVIVYFVFFVFRHRKLMTAARDGRLPNTALDRSHDGPRDSNAGCRPRPVNVGPLSGSKSRPPMHKWKRGDLVELDGLLAVVVGVEGDRDVPEDHVAVWFGDPRCERKSQGGSGGKQPEVWTVPSDHFVAAASPIWKH